MPGPTSTRPCPVPDRVADVVVLGAGALGAATAWWLARAGRSVVLLDERTPRQLRSTLRGTAWSAHPAWTDEATPDVVDAWRQVERQTGAALLSCCDALDHGAALPDDPTGTRLDPADAAARRPGAAFAGPVLLRPGAGVQVRADHAVAALTAAAVGAGAVLRYRTPVTAVDVLDGRRVEVRTADGRIRAHRVIRTTAEPAPVPGLELHFSTHHPLAPGTPLIAHHDPVLGVVRAVPCARGHLAVGADTWPRGTLRDLRDHVRTWFPGLDVERPEPVGPDAMSTGAARIDVRRDGPVDTATAPGSVGVLASARRLAEQAGGSATAAGTA